MFLRWFPGITILMFLLCSCCAVTAHEGSPHTSNTDHVHTPNTMGFISDTGKPKAKKCYINIDSQLCTSSNCAKLYQCPLYPCDFISICRKAEDHKCPDIEIGDVTLSTGTVSTNAEAPKPKKFEVIFTVKYNAITLEEAAKKEKAFRKAYKDACSVDIELNELGGINTGITLGTGNLTWEDATGSINLDVNSGGN